MKHPYLALGAWVLVLQTGCGFSQDGLSGAQAQPTASSGSPSPSGGAAGTRMSPGIATGGAAGAAGGSGGAGGQSTPPVSRDAAPASPPTVSVPPDGSAPPPDAPGDPGDAGSSSATTLPPRPDALPGLVVTCPREQDSLRLCLLFEDNLADESAGGRSVAGEQLSFEPGHGNVGRAARLGGMSSIRVPEADGLDLLTFTVEAWIKLDRLPPAGGRVAVIDKEARYGMFVLPNGALACSARGALAMAGAGVIPAGQWVAVACAASTSTVSTWVGGTKRAEAGAAAEPSDSLPGLAIGSNMPSGDQLIGALDNLRIWSRVLGAGEICAAAIGCQ